MQFNAREAIHLLELRSGAEGHPAYRRVVLDMHRLIAEQAGHRVVAEAMTHLTTDAPELGAARVRATGRGCAAADAEPTRCDGCHDDGTEAGGTAALGSGRVNGEVVAR